MGAPAGISLLAFPRGKGEPKSREAIRLDSFIFSMCLYVSFSLSNTIGQEQLFSWFKRRLTSAHCQGTRDLASSDSGFLLLHPGTYLVHKRVTLIFDDSLLSFPGKRSKFDEILLMEEDGRISQTVLP